MAAGDTTAQTLAADVAPVWIRNELLAIAEKQTVFADLGDEIDMPEGEGTTVQASRYERLPLPTAPLSDGVTPSSVPLTVSTVLGVLDQWGLVVTVTDKGVMTVKHPVIQQGKNRLGLAGSELWDREIQRVLMGTSNVTFGGGRASRALLVAGDKMTDDLAAGQVATLRQNGAPAFDGGLYAGVCDPYVEQDMVGSSNFIQAHSYSEVKALFNGEIGTWRGVRWKRSNLLPIITLLTPGTAPAAANIGAPASGETNFAAGTSVPVQITRLNPTTGFEEAVSAVTSVTNAGTFSVAVTIASADASGTYNIYVGLESGAVATLQTQVVHVQGSADVRTFFKSGVPSAANRFVAQATGPVAPPAAPAVNVHTSYIFAKGSFGVTKIGPRYEGTLTPAVASDSDPLKQRRKMGFKNFFKCIVQNTDFYRRLETTSAFN